MQSNYLPPLEPIGDFRSYVCGDVVIDQTAAIASGVLIQADDGGKIIIGAAVCIGMGAVLHAQDGLLEIGAGANLGAGVLVYGTTKIGEGACIGASSSIVRAIIANGAIVPPCSLISGLEQSAIVTATSESVVANSVERTVTETQIEITTEAIAEQPLETDAQVDSAIITPIETDITTLVAAHSVQAKAHAQSQINRFIKRLYPQN